MAQEPCLLDLHCLPFCSWFLTVTLSAIMDMSKFKDERVHFRHLEVKRWIYLYEGPAKKFVTGFRLVQCYVLSNIFITNLQSTPPLLKHIFVTFARPSYLMNSKQFKMYSRGKQIHLRLCGCQVCVMLGAWGVGRGGWFQQDLMLTSVCNVWAGLGGSVGCAVRLETRRARVPPRRGRQHSFVEIDHEIFSMVILSLPLIQEGQLSVSGERMCTILVNRLED